MPHLRCEIKQGLATIVLNNPPQNRLAPQMVDELSEIVNVVGRSEARAVLLQAEGPDFSFGGDIVPWPAMSPSELRTLFERYLSAFNQFEQMPIPTVAAVQTVMERYGVVNRLVEDKALIEEATAFAKRLAKGPTRAHAAHKTLLRTWATGGVAAADEAIFDIAMPLFETEDVKSALPLAIEAFTAGKPRPVFDFKGR